MKTWWSSKGIQLKLQIIIQLVLIAVLIPTQLWIESHYREELLVSTEARARISADGVINGMNMLMHTGMISDPEVRALYIKKMAASSGVKELRVIRAEQVKKQYGYGLPQEQPRDEMDLSAIANAREEMVRIDDHDAPGLRVVVPFIVSTNFRGTNCLDCHEAKVGTANGAASITLDLTQDYASMRNTNIMLWAGQVALQLLLYLLIGRFTHTITRPLEEMQATMGALQKEEDLARYVGTMPPLKIEGGDEISKLGATFNRMIKTLQQQMVSLSISEEVQQRYLTLEREEQARLMALLAVMNVGVLFVSRENRILHVNRTFFNIWNISEGVELHGMMVSEVPGYISHLLANDKTVAQHLLELPEPTDLYLADSRVVIQTCYAVRDVDAQIVGHLWMFEDVTHARRTPEQLLHLAEIDPLTGLYNRHRFAIELERSLLDAKRNASRVALVSFSLDEMDRINEAYGYAGGDKVLTRVADVLGKLLRANEICCRLRGDEFAVLIRNASEQDVKGIIRRVSHALGSLDIEVGGNTFRITINSGFALYPDHGEDQQSMIAHADEVINAAREVGRDT